MKTIYFRYRMRLRGVMAHTITALGLFIFSPSANANRHTDHTECVAKIEKGTVYIMEDDSRLISVINIQLIDLMGKNVYQSDDEKFEVLHKISNTKTQNFGYKGLIEKHDDLMTIVNISEATGEKLGLKVGDALQGSCQRREDIH
jgi:hypothetical protein